MRKKKGTKAVSQKPAWELASATIMNTMEFLTRNYDKRSDSFDAIMEDLIDESTYQILEREAQQYLESRLSMNNLQIQLLTNIFYYSAAHAGAPCDSEDLAHLMKIHPLRAMQFGEELSKLEDMGYLISVINSCGQNSWRVSREATISLQKNEAFDSSQTKIESSIDFLNKANGYINEGMRFDQNNAIRSAILRLMHRNTHLPLVRNLLRLNAENNEMWFILVMMTTLVAENDPYVSVHDLEQIMPARYVRVILRQIHQGTHVFAQKKYVEPYNQNGMAQPNQWVLSNQAWIEFVETQEDLDFILQEEETPSGLLTSYKDISKKELFFSGNTKKQIDRLSALLNEEQFSKIRMALKSKGLPEGFCCLFYGGPGTGKTELVQQLAIDTERDLMQVDLSTLRDKYVGESEKRVKQVFSNYRALLSRNGKAPILFFNEADAIFGNRIENTQHSVDKMENAIQNIILQEMEKFEGILICTTNLTSCMDKAFDRRFLYKVEFERPTCEARKQIWQSLLPGLNDDQAMELAKHFEFSGGQIQNISRKQIVNAIFSGNDELDFEQVIQDCQNEVISRQNGRKIGF